MLLSLVLDMISSMQHASILHIPSVLFIVPQFLHQKRLKLLSEIGDAHRAKLQNLGWPVSIEMGKIHAEEIGDQLDLLQVKLENEFEVIPQGSDCGIVNVNVPTNGAGIVCSFGDDREAGSDS
ncbi:Aldehyde dehydrogenase family 7 member A1 [Capsicum chinense]|nr:Aldehyde dehydrogenase family 7 member A1 [Capsicum chinense]